MWSCTDIRNIHFPLNKSYTIILICIFSNNSCTSPQERQKYPSITITVLPRWVALAIVFEITVFEMGGPTGSLDRLEYALWLIKLL